MNLFLPLSHPTKEGYTRVPVYRDPPIYTIKLDTDFKRVFTEQSLPDYVRTKIVIADAGYEPSDTTTGLNNNFFGIHDLFIYRGSYNLQDTAWRYDDNNYIVVLDKVEFNMLLGKDNQDGNTREES
jgi:hypothetical protein